MKIFFYRIATDQLSGGFITVLKFFLWIISGLYGVVVSARRACYAIGLVRQQRVGKKVVSIGNITVGGSGKTPLVRFLAQELKSQGIKVAILTRGYMGQGTPADYQASDEAAMLKDALGDVPVLIGANRAKTAREFLLHSPADLFLLDDGFQHLRLHRDLDIIIVDATNPWGNGCLLPRGILREPRKSLRKADIFVLTKTDLGSARIDEVERFLRHMNPRAMVVRTIHRPVSFLDERYGLRIDVAEMRGRQVCSVCSIGSPKSFKETLDQLGVATMEHLAFMDHHRYTAENIDDILKLCANKGLGTIVITEKDAVKFKHFLSRIPQSIQVLSLCVEIEITSNKDPFLEIIRHLL